MQIPFSRFGSGSRWRRGFRSSPARGLPLVGTLAHPAAGSRDDGGLRRRCWRTGSAKAIGDGEIEPKSRAAFDSLGATTDVEGEGYLRTVLVPAGPHTRVFNEQRQPYFKRQPDPGNPEASGVRNSTPPNGRGDMPSQVVRMKSGMIQNVRK